MRVSKTLDYALRAMLELTATDGTSLKADQIASAQHIPLNSLENILMDLKRADLITAQRGTGGGRASW